MCSSVKSSELEICKLHSVVLGECTWQFEGIERRDRLYEVRYMSCFSIELIFSEHFCELPLSLALDLRHTEKTLTYRVSQQEWTKIRESVPYAEL